MEQDEPMEQDDPSTVQAEGLEEYNLEDYDEEDSMPGTHSICSLHVAAY